MGLQNATTYLRKMETIYFCLFSLLPYSSRMLKIKLFSYLNYALFQKNTIIIVTKILACGPNLKAFIKIIS
jgi:hypothetical protein